LSEARTAAATPNPMKNSGTGTPAAAANNGAFNVNAKSSHALDDELVEGPAHAGDGLRARRARAR
jgi:hypothetical protein